MGDLATPLTYSVKVGSLVGIFRCVTENGLKVTFVDDANSTRELVNSGTASELTGIAIPKDALLPMQEGWPYRSRGNAREADMRQL